MCVCVCVCRKESMNASGSGFFVPLDLGTLTPTSLHAVYTNGYLSREQWLEFSSWDQSVLPMFISVSKVKYCPRMQ